MQKYRIGGALKNVHCHLSKVNTLKMQATQLSTNLPQGQATGLIEQIWFTWRPPL